MFSKKNRDVLRARQQEGKQDVAPAGLRNTATKKGNGDGVFKVQKKKMQLSFVKLGTNNHAVFPK